MNKNYSKSVDVLVSSMLMIGLAVILMGVALVFLGPSYTQTTNKAKYENAKQALQLLVKKIQSVQSQGINAQQRLTFSVNGFTLLLNDSNNVMTISLPMDAEWISGGRGIN